MNNLNLYFEDDFICNYNSSSVWSKLKDKTIMISGATGLIGSTLIKAIKYYNGNYNLNCRIIALVRDVEKGQSLLGEDGIDFIVGQVESPFDFSDNIDFIIHGACPTESSYMVKNPVELINTSVLGTLNLLRLAHKKNSGFLFLSSMEVYGEVKKESLLREDDLGYINPLITRSCYPESKRTCEMIVSAYAKEYGVDAKSIRLAQTIGPGIKYTDTRVFAMMARSAIEGKNIILRTKGESKHSYLYVTDAISAIIHVLMEGEAGKSYNASNPDTFCSIYQMGVMVANEFGDGRCEVKIESTNTNIYPKTTFLNLDITSISTLGWTPRVGLREMYSRLIDYMKEIRQNM